MVGWLIAANAHSVHGDVAHLRRTTISGDGLTVPFSGRVDSPDIAEGPEWKNIHGKDLKGEKKSVKGEKTTATDCSSQVLAAAAGHLTRRIQRHDRPGFERRVSGTRPSEKQEIFLPAQTLAAFDKDD